jgi:DNA-binding response OmpR family regulator
MATSSKLDSPRRHVLVVDDDRHLQFLASRILKEAGYDVDSAADGGTALEKIRDRRPDLVVLDITLPSLDGRAVLEHLQKLASPPPVLVLTAHGHNFSGAEAVRQQAAGLMAKPFSLRDFLAACERILAR